MENIAEIMKKRASTAAQDMPEQLDVPEASAEESNEPLVDENSRLTREHINMLLTRASTDFEYAEKDLIAGDIMDARLSVLKITHTFVHRIFEDMLNWMDETGTDSFPTAALEIVPEMLFRIMANRPTSAILGREDEWEDDPQEELRAMIGRTQRFTAEDIPGTSIEITSIQRNRRCHNIKRFNGDNRLAHRIDAVLYEDTKTGELYRPEEVMASPIRFITFPYLWQLPIRVLVEYTGNPKTRQPDADGDLYLVRDVIGSNGPEQDGFVIPEMIAEVIREWHEKHPVEPEDSGETAETIFEPQELDDD